MEKVKGPSRLGRDGPFVFLLQPQQVRADSDEGDRGSGLMVISIPGSL
jgi:hypothetical protein